MSDWAEAQRRMVALKLYTGRIDNDPGAGTLAAVERLLSMAEREAGIVVPKKVVEGTSIGQVYGDFPLPANFDKDYAWLGKIGTLPRILQEFILIYGVKETLGAGNNPTIMAWAREANLADVYTADSIAWCGLATSIAAIRAGYSPPAGPLWALNWLKFGVVAEKPSLGDVLCFTRNGGGHVGLYVGEDSGYYHVIGGNTQDSVSIARLAKGRLKGARRPAYKNPLSTWKPYQVTTGGTISTNEA